jgi:hypothetical protein
MKLSLPLDSQFDITKAIELANLIERSYEEYKNFKDYSNGLLTANGRITGSEEIIDLCVDGDASTVIPKDGDISYLIIDIFQQTIDKNNPIPMGFIAQRENNLGLTNDYYIIFRGTMEKDEWQEDFRDKQVPFTLDGNATLNNLGQVAQGFAELYSNSSNIETLIQNTFANKVSDSIRIFVSGHSLGAALATLAARHLVAIELKPILYTYASPRVGNHNFIQPLSDNINCYRIANSEDIVPYFPLATLTPSGNDMPNDFTMNRIKDIMTFAHLLDPKIPYIKDQYIHIGEPIYFTYSGEAVSLNHNMYHTYREALRN